MSIETQKIEIYEEGNPIESKFIDLPVHKGEKILSHESYAADALRMYSRYCSDDVMKTISSYETAGGFKDVREGFVSSYDEESSTAEISLSQKHVVMVDINPSEKITVGEKIDVVVTKTRGRIIADASSKSAKIERMKQELVKQIQDPTSAYGCTVKEVVYNSSNVFNGFIVDISGVKCFMPGTESDIVPLNDFNELLGKEMYVMPVNQIKDSIIVSHKEYLNTRKPAVLEAIELADKGQLVTGVISSVKHFGVFIIIDECVATLLSVSEMNEETENKFKNGQLKIGEPIQFYIDNIKNERVSITQTASKTEGWERLKDTVEKTENYQLKGVVKNKFDNGVVIISEEFNNITFFLSAKVVDIDKLSDGSDVILNVDSVDIDKKTVRLKID